MRDKALLVALLAVLAITMAVRTITLANRGPSAPPPDLIGTRPPEWIVTEWLNAGPLRLEDLRGQVVLVRWFTRT